MILVRRYDVSCSHQLTGMRPGHKCARPHGHNYRIELGLEKAGDLANGMVLDAEDIDVYTKPILAEIDHHHLNDLPESRAGAYFKQPTVENLVGWLWWRLGFLGNDGRCKIAFIRVYETEKLWAEQWRED